MNYQNYWIFTSDPNRGVCVQPAGVSVSGNRRTNFQLPIKNMSVIMVVISGIDWCKMSEFYIQQTELQIIRFGWRDF